MRDKIYTERLAILGAESLEIRRIKLDLGFYFKIIQGLVDISVNCFFTLRECRTRTNGKTLLKSTFNNNIERYIFKNRCINLWNILPANVVNANSFINLKKQLSLVDLPKLIKQSNLCVNWSFIACILIILNSFYCLFAFITWY